jgi:hypothetical protein
VVFQAGCERKGEFHETEAQEATGKEKRPTLTAEWSQRMSRLTRKGDEKSSEKQYRRRVDDQKLIVKCQKIKSLYGNGPYWRIIIILLGDADKVDRESY